MMPSPVKMLMGDAHRRRIAESVPPGGRYLEWGVGGTTIWLDGNLPLDVTMVSVEHHVGWANAVDPHLSGRCSLVVKPGEAGRNATIFEEDPRFLWDYIHAADGLGKFDVILVDGVARTQCGIQAEGLLKDEGTIFLHDAQRWWYDGMKALYRGVDVLPSCLDYPGPTLWRGALKSNHAVGPLGCPVGEVGVVGPR
jgi:hypothetical protein